MSEAHVEKCGFSATGNQPIQQEFIATDASDQVSVGVNVLLSEDLIGKEFGAGFDLRDKSIGKTVFASEGYVLKATYVDQISFWSPVNDLKALTPGQYKWLETATGFFLGGTWLANPTRGPGGRSWSGTGRTDAGYGDDRIGDGRGLSQHAPRE